MTPFFLSVALRGEQLPPGTKLLSAAGQAGSTCPPQEAASSLRTGILPVWCLEVECSNSVNLKLREMLRHRLRDPIQGVLLLSLGDI